MKSRIVIRADGGSTIGMGHITRCIALAQMLKNNFDIVFAIQDPVENVIEIIHSITQQIIHLPESTNYTTDALNFISHLNSNDIVILDGYHFKTDYQKSVKSKGCKLVCIDDLHAWHHLADAIINHAEDIRESDYSAESYTQFYLGLDYVLLRKEFLTFRKKPRAIKSIKKIFISMGAADVNNNTQKFTEALIQIDDIQEIHILLSSINPNLKNIKQLTEKHNSKKIITHYNLSSSELVTLLNQCDIAICPASSIAIESCAIGIGLISGYTADNQMGILFGLEKRKAIINIGDLNLLSIDDIYKKINTLIKDPQIFNEQIVNQKQLIDGKSPERLLKIFKNIGNQLHFRFAMETDIDQYFKWTNDKLVRENSYNTNTVTYEDHVKWFKSKLTSTDCFFYLFFNTENKPVGQVRIDKSKNEIIIGISIDEGFRGKSLGTEMLNIATTDYLQKHPSAEIVAYIKNENHSSYSIFKKVGFTNEKIVNEQGSKSYKLYYKR